MKYLIRLEDDYIPMSDFDTNTKFRYSIKSFLRKIGCFEIRIIELEEKFENENQLTLFASDAKKRFITSEGLNK